MKFSKIILMWSLFISIFMAFSTSSLFSLWISMEVNMMSFIPIMNMKTMSSTNSIILYFMVQALASSLFIMTLMIFFLGIINSNLTYLLMCPLLIKMGAAPFHIWFPQVSEGMTLKTFLILSTIQKLIPLQVTSLMSNKILMIPVIMSSLLGSLGGLNQISIRKIMAFSSITHLAWMLSLILINSNLWLVYFLIYTLIMTKIMNFFSIFNFSNLNQNYCIMTFSNALTISILLLSLGGLPPFLGFFMKWFSFKLIMIQFKILSLPLLFSSLLNLYFYIRIIYPLLLKNFNFNKFTLNYNNMIMSLIFFQILAIMFLIPMI
uniref:NADH-ubiquinone oxidoreductase chain 2 n=1 Tax=Carios vespertilionis TaxID=870211 RepID=A0A8B0R8S9_9ACAR|nr:NADH dehydrogenase subunit 2 [Carios vespertilionis]QTW91411.1 NADH dehydrogenase subunit 2 [Carios vespertilionis]QTW91424.1 NADH dehydrogenase subunit 2 [Carios vespertilionis]